MTAKKPKKSAPANAGTPATLTVLPVDRLHPNEYNPNRMTEEEFAELQKEVEHLGRLPKPVVVRPNGDGYTIVDGEHGWRAAQAAGMPVVPCEVIDADDFEAMRQTYKRNQHGTHDPLLLGRMFRRMLETRNLSARALAEEIAVSEGTVRNAVMYAEAADVRNCYAAPHGRKTVADLSVRQVRCYLKLGGRLADLWLDAGADVSLTELPRPAKWVAEGVQWQADAGLDDLRRLGETGLFEFVGNVYSASGFKEAVGKVRRWRKWESRWGHCDIDKKEFRTYSRHLFQGTFFVREESMMDSAIEEILDAETDPPTWLLTAEEFDAVLGSTRKSARGASHRDFMHRLSLAVADKTGKPPRETKYDVQNRLLGRRLEGAPDYIRQSQLRDPLVKFALWEADGPEEIKREIARLTHLPRQEGEEEEDYGDSEKALARRIWRLIREWQKRREFDEEWGSRSEQQLAQMVAAGFGIYDPQKDTAAIGTLAGKLALLTKEELFYLTDHLKRVEWSRAWRGESRGRPSAPSSSSAVGGEVYDADPVPADSAEPATAK